MPTFKRADQEQMEKAQDQVIRAHHAGPLVISGPAGSGKTTLALHRVAFLTQSPETMAVTSIALREWAGLIGYKLTGKIADWVPGP